ncbi:uncharacterized protein LOC108227963 [Daucus carota subsp. sativus]|uniref:uncharacterized protein LOC108227963 n=1 Tax=Daucus carota subsp. sativus TaxID=79200 RepID=UPI0007B1CCB3|nr:PREDICTED: uncharacterized protein LOC108227963 [Daucus carota subsp. sativus]
MAHRDMMGFGYVSSGGAPSSSSSNLSPLAPPFSVDRSKSKTNTNPLSNFAENSQSYGVPLGSSSLNWQYPQSSQPGVDYISYCSTSSENDSLQATSLPSANDYSYLGSELNNLPSVHWASPNPNTMDPKSNMFSYGGGSKQYYGPYVSQAVDDNASLVGLDEANGNHDLLSTSGLVPMVGSSQVDCSQGLSSLECQSSWGGYWNGLSAGKRGKRSDIDGSFHLKGTDLPGSHAYQDYLEQGVVSVRYSMFKENPTATESMHAVRRGRERNADFLAKEQLDSNLCQNLGLMPTNSSKSHIFGTSTSSHIESPFLEPVAFSSNHHMSYSSHEKGFQLFDSCTRDCISVTKTSVIPVIQRPISGTKYPVSDTVASKSMDSGDVTDVNRKDGSSYNLALEKEPHMPSSSDLGFLDANYLGFHRGRYDRDIFTAASSNENVSAAASSNENVSAKLLSNNSVDHEIKVREDHIPHTNVPHAFGLSVNNTEAFTANNTETSDQHNPAEDSPCWKGASASSFCPLYESSKDLPRNLMMELEACNSNDHNESVMGFSSELGGLKFQKESLSVDNNKLIPSIKSLGTILPTKEHLVADPARLKSGSVQENRRDRDQNLSNVRNHINQHNLLNKSKSDSGSIQSQGRPLCTKEGKFMHKSKIQLQSGDMDARISASDASEGCWIPLHNVENVLCSPPSEEDDGKLPAMELDPTMNVKTLVDALHNISELLVSSSFVKGWGLEEQCSKTLEHAIHNINLCLSKRILQSSRQELSFPKADISHLPEEGTTKPRLHAMTEVGNQLGSYPRHEQKRIHGVSDTQSEKNMDFNSSRNEADAMLHANMVQNIKVVFDENFQSEESISLETLLYKNLWLNAEAELCVTGLKARFDQVKIQMENCKSDKKKEDAVIDKIPSSGEPPDRIPNITNGSTPKANDSPKQKEPIQHNISSPRSDAKDVEASVMARFQILKRRGDNINTCNVEEKSLPYVTNSGFPCKIVGSQTGSKSFDVAVGSRIVHRNDHNSEKNLGSSQAGCQHEPVEGSAAYVTDNLTTFSTI